MEPPEGARAVQLHFEPQFDVESASLTHGRIAIQSVQIHDSTTQQPLGTRMIALGSLGIPAVRYCALLGWDMQSRIRTQGFPNDHSKADMKLHSFETGIYHDALELAALVSLYINEIIPMILQETFDVPSRAVIVLPRSLSARPREARSPRTTLLA